MKKFLFLLALVGCTTQTIEQIDASKKTSYKTGFSSNTTVSEITHDDTTYVLFSNSYGGFFVIEKSKPLAEKE